MDFNVKTTFGGNYDLIVCGGGPSGFATAVTAARQGLKTALIEQNGCFGGVSTGSRVSHLLGGRRYDSKTGKIIREKLAGFSTSSLTV